MKVLARVRVCACARVRVCACALVRVWACGRVGGCAIARLLGCLGACVCSTWRSVQDNQWFSPLARGKPRDPVVRGARLAERREQSRTILTACQNGEAEHLTRPASPGQGSQTLTAVLTCLTDL